MSPTSITQKRPNHRHSSVHGEPKVDHGLMCFVHQCHINVKLILGTTTIIAEIHGAEHCHKGSKGL